MLHLLIPAAGESQRFKDAGYTTPKGLMQIEWRGKRATMIEHIVASVGVALHTTVGVKFDDRERFEEALPLYTVTPIVDSTGQACTVAMMANAVSPEDELLVVNSDNAFDGYAPMYMVIRARRAHASAAALVFEADHDRYGFVDGYPYFSKGAEKNPISPYALAGAFYFRSAKDLVTANIRAAPAANGEFYLSGVFEHLHGTKLAVKINRDMLHEWGTPQSLADDLANSNKGAHI
jgi:dTDP-glucose pyrophosphorylase